MNGTKFRFVIPAQAGDPCLRIQSRMDSRLRGNDGNLEIPCCMPLT